MLSKANEVCMRNCEHCCFFKIVMVQGPPPGDRLIGHCHRFPPSEGQRTPLKGEMEGATPSPFPLVRASDWCGEFLKASSTLRRLAMPFDAKVPKPDLRLVVAAGEAAKMLGISERHLYSPSAKGDLPRVMIGARICYRIETLREWVASHEVRIRGDSNEAKK